MPKFKAEKILVALSGGVDSAVSAALLLEEGHCIESVYVRTWEYEDDLLADCPGAKDLADAEAVAKTLGIPFKVLNYIDFYNREVVQPMVNGYEKGITPNPDVLCNRKMKFGALLSHALEHRFDSLATGHYCRRITGKNGKAQLFEGADKNKDQSYFLARVNQEQLEHARFPLGELKKEVVRKIAVEKKIPVAAKKDSQGICFLGKVKITDFLSNFIEDNPGPIVTTRGNRVGEHRGLHRYTLGQRKGIGVPSNTDYKNFVVTGKNESSNELIVAFDDPDESTLWGTRYRIHSVSFLGMPSPKKGVRLQGKTRYRDSSVELEYDPISSDQAEISFESPQRALTPGQVLALYDGQRLIGSGIYSLSSLGRSNLSA